MVPNASPSTTTATHACIVCGTSAPDTDGLCSLPCALDAHQELRANVESVRRLRRTGASDADELRELTERNGRLSSALIRWRL